MPDDENLSKLCMKKNCVVKIAKMAWLDKVSRRERGQKKQKSKEGGKTQKLRALMLIWMIGC